MTPATEHVVPLSRHLLQGFSSSQRSLAAAHWAHALDTLEFGGSVPSTLLDLRLWSVESWLMVCLLSKSLTLTRQSILPTAEIVHELADAMAAMPEERVAVFHGSQQRCKQPL